MRIAFYTGPNCSLCDLAMDLIEQLEDETLHVEKINIRESTELYHLYGARIPVLKIVDSDLNLTTNKHNNKELGWPFTLEQLRAFLA